MKIMQIEKNDIDRFIFNKVFELEGINNIVSFQKHTDAISYLLNEEDTPDIIFIDVNLPERDGFDLFRKIKKLSISFDKTKFFFLSSLINPSDRIKARELSIDFIEKPLTIEFIKKHLS